MHTTITPRALALAAALGALAAGAAPAWAQALTDAQRQAALTALDDEYKAYALYEATIEKFGAVRPFVNIVKAEGEHIAAITAVLAADGTPIPPNPYLEGTKPLPPLPDTLGEVCAEGVQAEIDNYSLYDNELLPIAAGNDELERVFQSLRDASQFNHLPAFERCATR